MTEQPYTFGGASQADVPSASPGFHSVAARSRVKAVVWTLGILLGLVQLVLPVVSVIWIVIVILKAAFTGPSVEVANAAWYQGKIWIPQRKSVERDGGKKQQRWFLLGLGQGGEKLLPLPEKIASGSAPHLVADGKQLWVLRSSHRARLQGGKVEPADDGKSFSPASRPFVLEGAAVLDRDDRQLNLLRLEGEQWSDAGSIGLKLPDSVYPDDMVVIPVGDVLHVFFENSDDELLYGQGKIGGPSQTFSKISSTGGGFAAARLGGKFYLARTVDQEDGGDRLELLVQDGEDWNVHARLEGISPRDLHFVEHDGQAVMVVETLLGGVKLVRLDGARLEVTASTGRSLAGVLTWVFLPQLGALGLTILLVVILTLVLRSARDNAYPSKQQALAQHASLVRRSVARLVDTALVGLPLLVTLPWALMGGGTGKLEAVTGTGAQLGYAAWGLLLFGVFCAWEGANGGSPGKLLAGIRVLGLDLQPCGLNRSLIRNLMFFVDGMLGYLVGIMVVALSVNQQRVGDLVAKTIVVRHGSVVPGAQIETDPGQYL